MTVRIVAPAEYPVSLAEAKDQCNVTHSDEDAKILALVAQVTDRFDGRNGALGLALVSQTWRLTAEAFADRHYLAPGPVQSLEQVAYIDADGASQTFAGARLMSDGVCSWVELNDGEAWPATAARADAVQIDFVCGFGSHSDVPESIRGAILGAVKALYDEEPIPAAVSWLTNQHRVYTA